MSKQIVVGAIDLGAESGRVSLGLFDGEQVSIDVVHRFPNKPLWLAGTQHWNTLSLFAEIMQGLGKAGEAAYAPITALGIDTWGCDFGILDAAGRLLGVPVHYRDARTDGLIEEVTGMIPREEIYAQSGIAFWPFNTLYQLRALAKEQSPLLREGRTLLFTPDLLNYWLCGAKVSERSIASTSQCLAVGEDRWLTDLLTHLGIPASIMPEVVPAGTVLGPLLPEVAAETKLNGVRVIAPACHDTGSAVVATPLSDPNAAYMSSGTWSLLGIETPTPMPTPAALRAGMTNEKGACGTYRFLKNIMGLWLVQQSRAVWSRDGGSHDYAELAKIALDAAPFRSWVDPNDIRFYAPANMVAEVQAVCRETGQPVPESIPDIMRCLLESLAFAYRTAIEGIEALSGRRIPCLHITGGGSQNRTLCQWTANALGRPVIAGPTEGTAMGNILVQLMALGEIATLADAREVVRHSVALQTYHPEDTTLWEEAYGHYQEATSRSVV